MSLAPGIRLGAYEIVSFIGAGGMGEVYRARDTRLNRDIAIKILPDAFARDADRAARFRREAQAVASLNHPTIAQIHAFEDIGSSSALVLELVEGPTLADRIAQGPVPVDEAVAIATQIAEALEAAHEAGVIHRDLKPANIKLRPDGTVKVLDFGLAKALESPVSAAVSSHMSQSPTITSPAMTMGGVILGTAAYMSPEQAKGKRVDQRADIWAFGCVLYEMLTGCRAFEGHDVSDTIASVLRSAPDWSRLRADTPQPIRRLLNRCLAKDLKHRLADVRDVSLELAEPFNEAAAAEPAAARMPHFHRTFITASAGLVIGAIISGVAVWIASGTTEPASRGVRRFALAENDVVTSGVEFQPTDHNIAISPDGTRVAFIAVNGRLRIRSLDQLGGIEFSELGLVRSPFFSPDSKWLAFIVRGTNEVQKVPVTGGTPVRIATASGQPRGATWGVDGTIVFSAFGERGLWKVASGGGKPAPLAVPPENAAEGYLWPHFLPNGRAVLFAVARGLSASRFNSQVAVLDLQTGRREILIEAGTHPQYLRSGHLLYLNGSTLFAVPFDAARLETRGEPVPVLDGVRSSTAGVSYASVANDGTLVFLPGGAESAMNRAVIWVDRQGREETAIPDPQAYGYPRISPDGGRIALHVEPATGSYIVVHDVARKTSMRLTFGKAGEIRPFWSPDGRDILFRSEEEGLGIYRKSSDGRGAVSKIAAVAGDGSASSFSPDGRTLIFNSFGPATNRDVWALNLEDGRAKQLIADPGSQGNGVLSPDGRWLAYSDETEGYIMVSPFPDVTAGRWQISPPGSKWPLWSRDGRELYYVSGEPRMMMAVPVDPSERAFKWGVATALFPVPYVGFVGHTGARNYDLSIDGRRFLMIKNVDRPGEAAPMVVVENWFDELKQRLEAR